jgi:Na+/melibiose symporter-like transporter
VVEALGYTPAAPTAAGVAALAALYALLPCGLKIAAAVVVALSPLDPRPLR